MGLNVTTADILLALTTTNNKLDQIITLLGGVPPTPGHTIDDLYQVLSDIHLDTQSIDQKLLLIRDAILPTPGYPFPPVTLIDAVSAILPALQYISNATPSNWEFITGEPGFADDNILRWLSGIGINTGDATTTILGRLTAIENYSRCACGPVPPSPFDPSGCVDQFISIAQVTTPNYSGNFVQWPDVLPAGIEFTNDLLIGVSNVEISADPFVSGWRMFGYSQSASVFSANPGNVTQYPTNEWIVIGADNWTLAPSVGEGNDLRVYLCSPGSIPADCPEFNSIAITVSDPAPGNVVNRNAAIIGGYPLSDQLFNAVTTPACVMVGNFISFEITCLTGFARIIYVNSGGTAGTIFQLDATQSAVIPELTQKLYIDDLRDNITSEGSFTIKVCAPEPA